MIDPSRAAGVLVVAATGLGVLGVTLPATLGADSLAGLAIAGLGAVIGLALLGGAAVLVRAGVRADHVLRIAAWNALGVVVVGGVLLLASQVPAVSFPLATAVTIVGVSAVAHVLIGLTDVRRIRAEDLAAERRKLAVVNRLARHNIRNNAQILMSGTETIAPAVDTDRGRAALDRLRDATDRLTELQAELETFQRITDLETVESSQQLDEVVASVLAPYRERHPDADVAVSVEPLAVTATGDLEVAVRELVENAFEHGEADTGGLEITASRDGAWVSLTVADRGPGIPPEERAVLTGETDISQLEHASGLGLWITREIVERFGGDLAIDDDGRAVTLRLPAARRP